MIVFLVPLGPVSFASYAVLLVVVGLWGLVWLLSLGEDRRELRAAAECAAKAQKESEEFWAAYPPMTEEESAEAQKALEKWERECGAMNERAAREYERARRL